MALTKILQSNFVESSVDLITNPNRAVTITHDGTAFFKISGDNTNFQATIQIAPVINGIIGIPKAINLSDANDHSTIISYASQFSEPPYLTFVAWISKLIGTTNITIYGGSYSDTKQTISHEIKDNEIESSDLNTFLTLGINSVEIGTKPKIIGISGCNFEMSSLGWIGHLGILTIAQLNNLITTNLVPLQITANSRNNTTALNYKYTTNGWIASECIDTLANILALTLGSAVTSTTVPAGARAMPTDVAGCTLEMGADGKWVGTLGSLSKATTDALYASGALANLATGVTYRDTSGTQYTYSAGAGWEVSVSIPNILNLTTSSMRNYRRAVGRADMPDGGACHIAWFGDSIGLRAGGNNSYTVIDRVKSLLQRDFINYNGQAQPNPTLWFPSTLQFFTPTDTTTGTWTQAQKGPLGAFGYSSSVNGSKITWAAGSGCNAGRIHYLIQPGGGSFTISTTSNGNFPAQATSGALQAAYLDVSGGDGGISVTVDGSGPVTIMGYERIIRVPGTSVLTPIQYDGQLGLKVSRFSASGYKMSHLAVDGDNSKSLGYICDYLKPDLAVIHLMSNDGFQQTALSTYRAQAIAVANRMKAAGIDVLFLSCPTYQDPGNVIPLSDYIDQIKDVCTLTDSVFLDIASIFGPWSSVTMLDAQHPRPLGITLEANAIYRALQIMQM